MPNNELQRLPTLEVRQAAEGAPGVVRERVRPRAMPSGTLW